MTFPQVDCSTISWSRILHRSEDSTNGVRSSLLARLLETNSGQAARVGVRRKAPGCSVSQMLHVLDDRTDGESRGGLSLPAAAQKTLSVIDAAFL
jgi:hypothetical protein